MKRTISLALVVTALILAYAGSDGNIFALQQNKVEQELMQLERDWCTAQIKKDVAFFSRILADDFTQISSRGVMQTKTEFLAALKDPKSSTDSCPQRNVRVRLYGNSAVVTGLTTAAGRNEGVAFKDYQVLWTDTFIMKDERWQCVATQSTIIAAQQK